MLQNIRRVLVRTTTEPRNALGGKLEVVTLGSDKYLTLVHGGTCDAQADVEVRADGNQLVQVRVQIRECDSGLLNFTHNKSLTTVPIMLPPRHTRRFMLQLPGPPATERQHCLVFLLNGDNESVAVRDVVIKKGDQCYCVWHCDCVCYGDDPKLLCQEMSGARQDASGLPPRATRLARACHYPDFKAVNVTVVIIGVIGMLLCLGVLKGLLGLVYPRAGLWGLDRILVTPWQLDRYYERSLQCREVAYDDNCWPVHPDTRERTVRVVSLPVEFILNVIFFVVTPGLVIVDAFKEIPTCSAPDVRIKSRTQNILHRDIQMFPLRNGQQRQGKIDPSHTSGSDSEQDDTAFVLSQIKKSSESLARNPIKPKNMNGPSAENEMQ